MNSKWFPEAEYWLFGFQAASEFCPHHVGHYLGMDTHDTHLVSRGLGLHPGMVVTVEPGIYISADNSEVPERWAITINSQLQISHNTLYTFSPPPPPILHNLCFSFLLLLQPFQEKLKTMLMQFFFGGGGGGGGQIRCILGDLRVAILSSPFSLFSDWLIVPICPSIFCSVYKVDKNMSPFCDNISIT